MKKKVDFVAVISVVIITYVGTIIVCFWLNECVAFLGLYDVFFSMLHTNNEGHIYQQIWDICLLLSYVLSNLISYLVQKRRKKNFLLATKGLIKIKEGLIWHYRGEWLSEIFITGVLTILALLSYGCFPQWSPFSMIYRRCGLIFGGLITPVIIILFQNNHILLSQYQWRISFYKYE